MDQKSSLFSKIPFLLMLMTKFIDTNAQGNNKQVLYMYTVYKTPIEANINFVDRKTPNTN